MSTMSEPRDDEPKPIAVLPPHDADQSALPRCTRCNLRYLPSKSTSALRLTYCSFLCELGDLGFSMTGLEHMERKKKEDIAAPPEPVSAS